jgi:hypothetical protein
MHEVKQPLGVIVREVRNGAQGRTTTAEET